MAERVIAPVNQVPLVDAVLSSRNREAQGYCREIEIDSWTAVDSSYIIRRR